MIASRPLFALLLSTLAAVACSAPPVQPRARTAAALPSAQPAPAPDGLYAPDEALKDALSGPWEHLGTGAWPGISRMNACVFRNARVFIVNVYCTIKDAQAVRVDIYSPQRGRARVYAESKGRVSERDRRDYFTFTAESEPPPGPQARMAPLSLAMSFQQLRVYEEQRYGAYLPGCFGGQELSRKREGCLGALAPRAAEWTTRSRAFLEQASADWYRVVRELRAAAARYGREPD